MTKISFEEWYEKYQPEEVSEGGMKLYETYEDDFEKVWATDRRFVWTLVEGDSGHWYLVPGISYVNRMNYVICKKERDLEERFEPIKYM